MKKCYILSRIFLAISIIGIVAIASGFVMIFVIKYSIAPSIILLSGLVITTICLPISIKLTSLSAFDGDKRKLKSTEQAIKKGRASYKKEQKRITQAAQHPQCPVCFGYNTKRISTAHRIVSTELFGLASSTIGKQYECLDCSHKW